MRGLLTSLPTFRSTSASAFSPDLFVRTAKPDPRPPSAAPARGMPRSILPAIPPPTAPTAMFHGRRTYAKTPSLISAPDFNFFLLPGTSSSPHIYRNPASESLHHQAPALISRTKNTHQELIRICFILHAFLFSLPQTPLPV